MNTILLLISLAVISFIQNMAFTFTSRSRNSGDPAYHRRAAWGSNGIWMINQIFLVKIIWEPVMSGDWLYVAIAALIYIVFTTEGSVYMMRLMLGHTKDNWISKLFREKGDRQVGAQSKREK